MTKTYLALGDSMSIDDYTGVAGGGAMWEPMVIPIMPGLASATVRTLGAVPVLHALCYRVRFEAEDSKA